MDYVGRFAPSPTGPLHFGSLVAALGSYLDARSCNGDWLLRIEDLDPPRESKQAPAIITEQLRRFGMHWDGDILYQSTRLDAYSEALSDLDAKHLTFPCTCSRKSITDIYPGHCRHRKPPERQDFSIRLAVPAEVVSIEDRRLGNQRWQLERDVGDFIIKRKDGLFAYQLAVVVDDIYQNVTHIVRGIDLLDSTPRQLAIYRSLGVQAPNYLHIPIVVDKQDVKLSKQTGASPAPTTQPVSTLRSALKILGQNPQNDAQNVADLLARATDNWDTSRIPAQDEIRVPDVYR